MEQKKTLFIIAAAGIFLAVVIGTACIIYSPSKKNASTVATISPVEKKVPASIPESSGWTNSVQHSAPDTIQQSAPDFDSIKAPEDYSEMNDVSVPSTSVRDLIVYSDNTTVYGTPQFKEQNNGTTIDLNDVKPVPEAAPLNGPNPSNPGNINITVNVTDKTSAKVQNNESPAPAPVPAKAFEEKGPEPKKPAPVPETTESKKVVKAPAPAKTTKASAKTVVKAEVSSKPEAKKIVQYWVQVASYSNKKSAEEARSILDENKIPSDIFTYKDNKGNLFYRVRIGPYTTKSEGEYWKSRIIKIEKFADAGSYVTSN